MRNELENLRERDSGAPITMVERREEAERECRGRPQCAGARCRRWRAATVVALIGIWLAAPRAVPAAAGQEASSGFLPERAVFVILAGLAGDVESETAYRDQIERWLGIAADPAVGAVRVHLLWDAPEAFTSTPSLTIESAKANRSGFLALSESLAGGSEPLVVVAIGHGGMQGRTPVLHVRGPRLTADDFRAFAERTGRPTSRWVLAFRGSGRFAAAIAAPGRVVLATDHESPAGSDPIGLPLLGRRLRSEPTVSTEALAAAWGAAVAAWYDERGLLRTEEPSLWIGSGRGVPLAGKEGAITLANRGDGPPLPDATEPVPLVESPAPRAVLPPSWAGVEPADPADHPGADAIVLRRGLRIAIGDAPTVRTEHETFVQIVTPEGARYGDVDLAYSPPGEEIEIVDAEVLGPDGRVERLAPDAVHESVPPGLEGYGATRRKFFSLPGLVPGAIAHLRYRRQWGDYPLPHASLSIPLGGDAPTLEAGIDVTIPKGAAFHFRFEGVEAGDPELRQSAAGSSYRWTLRDVPSAAVEALTPPWDGAVLHLSTFPDWRAFAEWYHRISRETEVVTPEIEAETALLTKGAASERDKLEALYRFVTGMRYVAVPLGVNSIRPHAAANVFRNRYGDCKDKANLLNTMLRAAGIESDLVLVPRFSQAWDDLPGFSFNHAISRVRIGDEFVWVDTTDDFCRFGMLPPGDSGRRVLVIDGESEALESLPVPDPADHILTVRGTVDASEPRPVLPAELRAEGTGIVDYALRTAARDLGSPRAGVPVLERDFRVSAGIFALDAQSWGALGDLGAAFAWRGEGRALGIASAGGTTRIRVPFWIPDDWDVALHSRTRPMLLHDGYPLRLDEEIRILLPEGAGTVVLPESERGAAGPLNWEVSWAKDGKTGVVATLRAEISRAEFTAEEAGILWDGLAALHAALGGAVEISSSR